MSYYQVAAVSAEFDRLNSARNFLEAAHFGDQERLSNHQALSLNAKLILQNQERIDDLHVRQLQVFDKSIDHQAIIGSSESIRAELKSEFENMCVVSRVHCLASKILSRLFQWRNPTDEEKRTIDRPISKDSLFQRRVIVTELCLPVVSIIAAVELIAYATLTFTLSYVPVRFVRTPNFFPLFVSSARTTVWSVAAMVHDNFARMSLETDEVDSYERITSGVIFLK